VGAFVLVIIVVVVDDYLQNRENFSKANQIIFISIIGSKKKLNAHYFFSHNISKDE
jgi:hypothetical protein